MGARWVSVVLSLEGGGGGGRNEMCRKTGEGVKVQKLPSFL